MKVFALRTDVCKAQTDDSTRPEDHRLIFYVLREQRESRVCFGSDTNVDDACSEIRASLVAFNVSTDRHCTYLSLTLMYSSDEYVYLSTLLKPTSVSHNKLRPRLAAALSMPR